VLIFFTVAQQMISEAVIFGNYVILHRELAMDILGSSLGFYV